MPGVISTNSVIRVGFVAATMREGGAENWQLDLIDAVNANPPAGGVYWQGCVVLEDTAATASPTMLASTQAVLPVAFGEDALYSMATLCDVLIAWSVYPFPAMTAVMSKAPKIIYAAHRAETWAAEALEWLAPASAIVACSPLAAAQLPSQFSSISSTILNAIDPARLTASTSRHDKRASWGVPAGNQVVGFLGRLEPERDPLAMVRLINALPDGWTAVVVGEGSKAGLIALINTQGNLILTGADPDAGSCLSAFDWLLQPTLAESFGYSTAEAWWLGVPVIATPHGLPSLQPALIRSIPDNAEGPTLAAALLADVADPSGTSSRVSDAQSWATSNLSPTAFGTAWSNLLRAVAGGGVGGLTV